MQTAVRKPQCRTFLQKFLHRGCLPHYGQTHRTRLFHERHEGAFSISRRKMVIYPHGMSAGNYPHPCLSLGLRKFQALYGILGFSKQNLSKGVEITFILRSGTSKAQPFPREIPSFRPTASAALSPSVRPPRRIPYTRPLYRTVSSKHQ